MATELNITIRDSERKLQKDFLIYESFTFVDTDPIITKCIKEVVDEFKGEPDDIRIKAKMVIS